jgi:hypothetical protein
MDTVLHSNSSWIQCCTVTYRKAKDAAPLFELGSHGTTIPSRVATQGHRVRRRFVIASSRVLNLEMKAATASPYFPAKFRTYFFIRQITTSPRIHFPTLMSYRS